MIYTQQGRQNDSPPSSLFNWKSRELLKQESGDIMSKKVNNTTYLYTYVQVNLKNEKQNIENTYPAYLCLCYDKKQKNLVFGIVKEIKGNKNQKNFDMLIIQIPHLKSIDQHSDKVLFQEAIKKQKNKFQVTFQNFYVHFRWFTLLKNLRYYILYKKENNIQEILDFGDITKKSESIVKSDEIPFINKFSYNKHIQLLKMDKSLITQIKYKQLVFFTVVAKFQHINMPRTAQHLECILGLYFFRDQVYWLIAYSNIQYKKYLAQQDYRRVQVIKQLEQGRHIHIQTERLSEISWNQPAEKLIDFKHHNFEHSVYFDQVEKPIFYQFYIYCCDRQKYL